MVRVNVTRTAEGCPLFVEICGHSSFDEHGRDIVCAAVSMLVQTVIFAIEDLLELDPGVIMEEGYVHMTLPRNLEIEKKEKLILLVETMLLGLKETVNSYPDFIQYREELET